MLKRMYHSFKIAFSMYSKIPMPKSEWNRENMAYCMCFFPLIGIVIGAAMFGWNVLMTMIGMDESTLRIIGLVLVPVVITGGIHLDGLLDTADALSSYQDISKRLEILKDSRAGAFAVIAAVVYFLCDYGIYADLVTMANEKAWLVMALSFVLSRSLSGYAIVVFPKAKDTGLAVLFSDGAAKRTVRTVLTGYLIVITGIMCWIELSYGIVTIVLAGMTFAYYYHMSQKKFGGITGDLAGWFLQICELVMAFGVLVVLALGGIV